MYHFCTYFDINYLVQGISLYRSLVEHCERPFKLYVLCLDEEAFRILERIQYDSLVPIRLADVEKWDMRLKTAKENRSRVEYYFTLSPALPAFVLEQFERVDCVMYLDADVFFFSSPGVLFEEMGDASILITEHRFSEHLLVRQVHGRFNVQCQAFRNDEEGQRCLTLWRRQCIEWCYDQLEENRYADQKYLDAWPDLYESLIISQNRGVGVASWNVHDCVFTLCDDKVFVNGHRLVFFHFHGFKWLGWSWCKTGLKLYHAHIDQKGKRLIFGLYLKALRISSVFLDENASYHVSPYKFRSGIRDVGSWYRYVYYAIRDRDYYAPWISRIDKRWLLSFFRRNVSSH